MVEVENQELLERVNAFLNKDVRNLKLFDTIEALLDVAEKQQKEYITLSQSIAEDDALIELLQQEAEQKQKEIGQYQLQETILLERLEKQEMQMKEMKQNSRLQRFYDMAEENLKMAQELAGLKEMLKEGQNV